MHCCANTRLKRMPIAISSRPSKNRKRLERERLKACSPKTRKTMGWYLTNSAWITCSSTRPIISKTSKPPQKWNESPAFKQAAPNGLRRVHEGPLSDERNPGHGVTFATGTPISNTMVEMYTMQRFLDPEGLQSAGIEHFDAWAATFGEVVDTMEISPDGAGLRPRSRFARFTNLPELQQMFRAFADVQTAEMLNLPRPTLSRAASRSSWLAQCRRNSMHCSRNSSNVMNDCGRRRWIRASIMPSPSPPTAGNSRPMPECLTPMLADFSGVQSEQLIDNVFAHLGKDGIDPRHANDFLRHRRQSDRLGLFALQ